MTESGVKKLKASLVRERRWNVCTAYIYEQDIPKTHKRMAMRHCLVKHFGKWYTPSMSVAHTAS